MSSLKGVVALTITAFCLMGGSSQARVLIDSYGPAGELGGQFGGQMGGIAVNSSGAGGVTPGTVYVADRLNNRVQRFSPSGAFERSWGQNVLGPDEWQRVELSFLEGVNGLQGGTYTLSFGGYTTSAIPALTGDPDPIEDALAALPSIGVGNVSVARGENDAPGLSRVWIVRFTGTLGGSDVDQMTADGSGLIDLEVGNPPPAAAVTTVRDGAGGPFTGFEPCTIAASCQPGQNAAVTANGGQLNQPDGITVDQVNGHVYVSEVGNRRISEFDADGNFLRTFGWDVVIPGGTGDVPGPTLNELQSVTLGANTTGGKFALSFEGHTTGASGRARPTVGSNVLTNVTTIDGNFAVGQVISGERIPIGTTIAAIGADTLTLSTAATGNANGPISVTAYDIAWDASPAAVQASLEDLPGIGAGNVSVSSANPGGGVIGGPYTVTFQGALADTNVAQQTAAFQGGLSVSSGQASVQILTEVGGHPHGYEVCTVATECKEAAEATESPAEAYGGRFVREPGGLAVDSSGNLWVADPRASRIQEFDPTGGFVAAYGWDVDTIGGSGGLEKCISSAPGGCRAATTGSAAGQFGSRVALQTLTFDSAGNLYAVDEGRVERFDPTMSSANDFVLTEGTSRVINNQSVVASVAGGNRIAITAFSKSLPGGIAGVFEYDLAGDLVETSIPNASIPRLSAQGLFFDQTSSRLYATNFSTSPNVGKVLILGNASAPASMIDPVASFGARDATFTGTVDPMGGLVSCRFQRSVDQVNWNDVVVARGGGKVSSNSPTVTSVSATEGTFEVGQTISASDGSIPPGTTIATVDVASHTLTLSEYASPVNPVNIVSLTATGLPDCDSLSAAGGAQAVSQEAVGLAPLTHYFVRLRVTRLFDDTTAVNSSEREFTTEALPPEISNVGVRQVDATSATLVGLINPNNVATTHHFEYGSAGPCDGNPCISTAEGSLAAGIATPTVVSAPLTGLEPDTTYHLRLLADNSPIGGPSTGTDVTFHTRATPLGPDVRGYEMVSPPDKNGGSALAGTWRSATLAHDGEAVSFCTTALFGEPSGVQISTCAEYLSRRSGDGWQTQPATPYVCSADIAGGTGGTGTALDQAIRFSADLDAAAFLQPESVSCGLAPLDPAAKVPQKNLYRVDYLADPRAYQLLSPGATSPQSLGSTAGIVAATSEDFSHIVYASPSLQTADAPAGSFDKLYEWDNGTLRLASVMPNGSPAAAAAQISGGGTTQIGFGFYGLGNLVNAISNDGSRIFFQTPVGGLTQELYLREGGSATYDVSQSECTVTCGSSQADSLLFATPDGSKAFFSSAAKLVNEDTVSTGADLYLYSHPVDPVANPPASDPNNLTLLSKDNEPADGNKATVQDVLGVSNDGETAYFAAEGQIVAGASTASGPKLYRWSWNEGSPMTQYLATLDSSDSVNWSPGAAKANEERLVTPDGRYLLVNTVKVLDPIDDRDADRDYYRWDQANGWLCVSCIVLGGPSSGDAGGPQGEFSGKNGLRRITMSEDGSRVFFRTQSTLVPEDTDGIADVYEWHEGQIELISTNTSTRRAFYLGAGASGNDVFFTTREGLVGADTDGLDDIYDARIKGGFPEETVLPPCDLNAGACEGRGTAPPTPAGAGSAAFQGPGNPSPNTKPRCPKGKRSVRRGGKPRCVKRHSKRRQRANGDRRAGR